MSFTPNPDVRLIYDALAKLDIGEEITYEAINDIVGYDIQKKRTSLTTAMNRCFKNDGHVFETIKNVGIKRLADADIVRKSDRNITSIRRKTRRSALELSKVQNFNNLSSDMKKRHNATMALLGAVNQMSQPNKVVLVESKVNTTSTLPNLNQTLEMFKN